MRCHGWESMGVVAFSRGSQRRSSGHSGADARVGVGNTKAKRMIKTTMVLSAHSSGAHVLIRMRQASRRVFEFSVHGRRCAR